MEETLYLKLSESEWPAASIFEWQSFSVFVCGGVGNPVKFWCECGGESAVVDYDFSPENDLSKFSASNQILRALIWFSVVGIDLPCNTWSRARRAPELSCLPKPLRSREYIFGLPNLKPSDHQKVVAANRMFFGAVKVIRKCLKIGVAGLP